MLTSFLGRNKLLYPIRKKDDSDFIVVLNGRESKRCCDLGHHILFHLFNRTKLQTAGNIHHQHDRQLALFLINLHIRFIETRSHIPVNVANIIAELIFTDFRESHSPTFEGRVILACKNIIGQSACLNFNLANLL